MSSLPSVVSLLGTQPIQRRRDSLIKGEEVDHDTITEEDTKGKGSFYQIEIEDIKKETVREEADDGASAVNQDERKATQKPILLWDWRTETSQTDLLHSKSDRLSSCGRAVCRGSQMNTGPANKVLPKRQASLQAAEFIKQYYEEGSDHDTPPTTYNERLHEVLTTLEENDTYSLTRDELTWGARTAWRNAPRCPARMIWKNLHVFDKREVFLADEMFSALVEHLEYSFNTGNIRPAVTIFRVKEGGTEPRVWNSLLVGYAGYKQRDGSVVGDPSQEEFTKFCQDLGWSGKGGMFDFLPLVVSGTDGVPHFQELSADIQEKLRVKIKHPSIRAINDLNIEWFGLPGVSSMMLEIGGIQFPASPFTGWYQVTEIANRDLLDSQRYNLLLPLGKAMNLDTSTNTNLWKDEVALELNRAVLHSFKVAGVSIVDHYTQADQFVEHMKAETRSRRGCPADWVWIVPPQSGSLCSSYHQEMISYHLSPSYEYQDKPWQAYGKGRSRKAIRSICWSFLFMVSTYKKIHSKRIPVSFIYGSETGVSKQFAYQAAELFSQQFRCQIYPMNDVDVWKGMADSKLNILIASTFGGDPPAMAKEFEKKLAFLVNMKQSNEVYEGRHYGVFGVGSSAYSQFVTFGKFLNSACSALGGIQILPFGVGDEERDQKLAFQNWIHDAFFAACKVFNITVKERKPSVGLLVNKYKWTQVDESERVSFIEALEKQHGYEIHNLEMKRKLHLHTEPDEPKTLQIDWSFSGEYESGDHISICPTNSQETVKFLLSRMTSIPPVNIPLQLTMTEDCEFAATLDLPSGSTLMEILVYFVNLSSVPSQDVLKLFSTCAKDTKEKGVLENLSEREDVYQTWKKDEMKGICGTLEDFSSVSVDSAQLLSQLPLMRRRTFSVASSPHESNLTLVVGVVEYDTPKGDPKQGLLTGHFLTMSPGSVIPAFLRKTDYRLPDNMSRPIIMIGAGTGIAPFKGFWMKRLAQKQEGHEIGKMMFYFGCRKKSMDLLKTDTDLLRKQGINFVRRVALSRERGEQRHYVQDLVREDAEDIYRTWMEEDGVIFVCGKVAMAEEVGLALRNTLEKYGYMDKEQATQVMKDKKSEGSYQLDLFG